MSETNSNFTVITEHFVNVTITSNIFSAYECGKRFSKDLTIFILKVLNIFIELNFFYFLFI